MRFWRDGPSKCWLVLLPSIALFGGLPLDPDYAVPAAEKKKQMFIKWHYM